MKSDFKAWDGSQIVRTHLQFCKRYLEVSNKASNVARRAELGRFPLIIAINQRILSYFLYLQKEQPDSLVTQSFLISSDLHTAGRNSFHSNLMKISEYFNFENFSPDLLDTAKVKMFLIGSILYNILNQRPFGLSRVSFQYFCVICDFSVKTLNHKV